LGKERYFFGAGAYPEFHIETGPARLLPGRSRAPPRRLHEVDGDEREAGPGQFDRVVPRPGGGVRAAGQRAVARRRYHSPRLPLCGSLPPYFVTKYTTMTRTMRMPRPSMPDLRRRRS